MVFVTAHAHFFVPGVPRPQGSKNHVGGGRMVESSKGLTEWRWRIGLAANQIRHNNPLFKDAVRVTAVFVMPRPKAMQASTPTPPHTGTPDLDKLVRGVLDALTGTLLVDDALVVDLGGTRKRYAEPAEQPGVEITVERI
jgi:crossover junction endodeoxyribonuclease RusA